MARQVCDLESEREAARADVKHLREEALVQSMRRRRLQEYADELGDLVELARGLLTFDDEQMHCVPAPVVFHMAMWTLIWQRIRGADPLVPPPDSVRGSGPLFGRLPLRLSYLLVWVLRALAEAADELGQPIPDWTSS